MTMKAADDASSPLTEDDMHICVAAYLKTLAQSEAGKYLPQIVVSLHPGGVHNGFKPRSNDYQGLLFEEKKDKLVLHIFAEKLTGIPTKALQGWLGKELFMYIVAKQPELYRFNFKKDILPLFYVSGSMVQLTRYLVHQIEIGLRQSLVTNMILDAGQGTQLVYYHLYALTPSENDKEDYDRFLPHPWLRAIFLSQKLVDFQSVYILSRDLAGPDMRSYWWNCHDHFKSEDRVLLETLAETSHRNQEELFASRLIDIFKIIRANIITPSIH